MRLILLIWAVLAAPMAMACGVDSDCAVGDRSYRISMPDGARAPVGAVIWAHGYRGTAAGVMRNKALRKMVHDRGLALIAVQGVEGTWDLPKGPGSFNSTGASEFAYFDAVIADASKRFDIDTARLVASGFSAGGMMVWNLACAQPDMFAGFVPMSGTYWLEPPATCAAPVASIVHIHGDADSTVPLDGRVIGPTRQGKVSEALATYADFGGFGPAQPVSAPEMRCEAQTNARDDILEFCLFEGGHSFSTAHLAYGIDELAAAGKL
ncbi:prolyl oligopeptidase family serine peptidase [Sulfitobacter sp.]|uniref:alpha/beta hydrolase family esterase n=1 Tax=Sulfitobacter sp. TaxID=1903071 RepID=UPI0032997C08